MNDSALQKLIAVLSVGSIGTWADVPADIQALAYLMLIDTLTGVLGAFKGRSANSNTLGKGLRKKLAVAAIIAVCFVGQAAGLPAIVADVAVLGFIGQEVLSIIENVGILGVKLPGGLAARLSQLQPTEPEAPHDPHE